MPTSHWVANIDELRNDGDRVIVEVDGLEIAVFRLGDDLHAILNFCPHQSGPLCDGELTGRTLMGDDGFSWKYDTDERFVLCPWHGWVFDVTTGINVDHDRYRVPIFDVELNGEDVFVVR